MKRQSLVIWCLLPLMWGCDIFNPKTTKLQWMPDMADAPTVKSQKGFLDPPEFSVPMEAVFYPETHDEAEKELRNPIPNMEEVQTRGKFLYETYCAVCHSDDGSGGKGYLGDSYPLPIPSIIRPDIKARGDGYFYMQITRGNGSMPGYGYAIRSNDRWILIHYIRQLQGANP